MTRGPDERRARWLVFACAAALLLAIPVIATTGVERTTMPTSTEGGSVAAGDPPAASVPQPTELGPSEAEHPAQPVPEGHAQAAVAAAEAAAAGSTELGVAVLDRATGEVAVGARGAEPFYTASLSKVAVAVDVLDRRRLEGLAVADRDIDLIRRALGPSDDSAMNALWTRFGGTGVAGRLSKRLGLAGTSDPRNPSQWGEMSVPAIDTVRIWQYIVDEMPAADRELLVSAMAAAPARARDGFDQAFGLLAPAVDDPDGPGAVAKQGWMCCFSSHYYLHTAGAVGPQQRFLVALLTRIPRGPGWEAARAELTRIATVAVQALG